MTQREDRPGDTITEAVQKEARTKSYASKHTPGGYCSVGLAVTP